MMQKVKSWRLIRQFKHFYMDELIIEVNFINGERMLLDIPEVITDVKKINDEFVEIKLKKAIKKERIDKLNSILHEEN